MKKLIRTNWRTHLYVAFVLLGTWVLVNSCEEDGFFDENEEECMTCWKVTYENGEKISESDPESYCDEELEEILSEEPVTIGDKLIQYECE